MNQTFFSTLYLKVEGKLSKQKKPVTVNIFFLVCNPQYIVVSQSGMIQIFQGSYSRCLWVSMIVLSNIERI
jgi:hypothetical protein